MNKNNKAKLLIKSTDWNNYYQKPFRASSITRKISEKKIIKLLDFFNTADNPKILEFGGANSCFAEAISYRLEPTSYSVADNNSYGLSLFIKKHKTENIFNAFELDILNDAEVDNLESHDIVFSVGLIEHFNKINTARSIEAHFAACKRGGIVLITFPTPTFIYNKIRFLAEFTNKWDFPDERPLEFDEVNKVCSQFGEPLHQSINWLIGLTQGFVIYQKN